MTILRLFALCIALLSFQAMSDCFPPNHRQYPAPLPLNVGVVTSYSGLRESQYLRIIEGLLHLFQTDVNRRGLELVIEKDWQNPLVNALANRLGNQALIFLPGGLARHPFMTEDTLALIICHELGHHLGGAPKHPRFPWASVEGEADYYASLKCFRRYALETGRPQRAKSSQGSKARGPIKGISLTSAICIAAFSESNSRVVCERSVKAAETFARIIADLGSESFPRLDRPDPTVAQVTLHSHPPTQCRLDTLVGGAMCGAPIRSELSDDETGAGACTASKGWNFGFRPRCWFAGALHLF